MGSDRQELLDFMSVPVNLIDIAVIVDGASSMPPVPTSIESGSAAIDASSSAVSRRAAGSATTPAVRS